ncbi:DegV family protein [Chloroflexota bacterium]
MVTLWHSYLHQLSKSIDSIVRITLSKALSATHEATLQAEEIFKSDHPVINSLDIDSRTAAGAQGFAVLEAAIPLSVTLNISQFG